VKWRPQQGQVRFATIGSSGLVIDRHAHLLTYLLFEVEEEVHQCSGSDKMQRSHALFASSSHRCMDSWFRFGRIQDRQVVDPLKLRGQRK
jgi:hypothetical protein